MQIRDGFLQFDLLMQLKQIQDEESKGFKKSNFFSAEPTTKYIHYLIWNKQDQLFD